MLNLTALLGGGVKPDPLMVDYAAASAAILGITVSHTQFAGGSVVAIPFSSSFLRSASPCSMRVITQASASGMTFLLCTYQRNTH